MSTSSLPLDWDRPEGWEVVFAGSDATYLVIPFTYPGASDATPDLIRAVGRGSVPRVVLPSSLHTAEAAPDDP